MALYKETVKIFKEQKERWNYLLSKDIDDMTAEELAEHHIEQVKKFDNEGGFHIEFNDNSFINIDLCSGPQNYFDEINWYSADGKRTNTFDCHYEIAEHPAEFTVGDDTYIIEWIVID